MAKDIRITILIEDTASQPRFFAEHGLSFWISYADKYILFDTGQSDNLIRNAQLLNVNLAQIDAIVISHGHYDHTGGLASVLKLAANAVIYLHPAALESKFSQKPSRVNMIGMSESTKKSMEDRPLIWTAAPTQLFPGILVTGQVPRLNDYEDVGGDFFVDENCRRPDQLLDDQTLLIESAKGVVVVFGCAHAGVVNTLDYISRLTNHPKIYGIIGGMHLLHASPTRIKNTIEALKRYDIQKIVPLHCTGPKATEYISRVFGEKCSRSGAGGQITF